MARSRIVQSNLTSGEIAPTVRGRIDIAKYYNGLSHAENVIIMPHGGVRRRPGLQKVEDEYIGEDARIEAFVFSATQSYLILFRVNFIDIYKDGALVSTEASPYSTIDQIRDVDVIQSADTMILLHEDVPPYQLQRQGSDTSWLLSTITLTNIPQFDFGSGNEDVWSVTRGWPRTATFHSARLWFGGSRSRINSIWGSVVNDFFNFDVGTGAADDAIFDTLDTDQFNAINAIYSGRHLQVFTSGGEFYNRFTIITPSDSSWSRQTSYGAIKVRPISVDGATMFIDSSARTIRQYLWSFNEDSYISINATLISSHLINSVRSFDTIRGTGDDISDFVYVVNGDGTLAVMNTMRHEEISGWTHWTTFGTFEDVAVVGKEVYFLVNRRGIIFLELLKEGTYTDHNSKIFGTEPEEFNVVYGIDNVVFGADNVVYANAAEGVPVNTITLNEKDAIAVYPHKVIADGYIQPDQTPTVDGVDLNHITITRDAYSIETGFDYTVKVRTLPLNVETGENGPIVNLRKRVTRVILNLYESLGVYVDGDMLADRQLPYVFGTTAVPYTGIKEKYLLGYGRQKEVEITQQQPLPMHLMSIDSEIEG